MNLKSFAIAFRNTTLVNGVRDEDAFLFLQTENTGLLRFTPNGDAKIEPGTLEPLQDSNPDFNPAGSVFYLLGLNAILSDEQIAGITFDQAWQAASYQDAANGRYWAFSPRGETVVAAGQALDLGLAHIAVGGGNHLPTTKLTVTYYNVTGLTLGGHLNHNHYGFQVALRDAGSQSQSSLKDKLDYGFTGGLEAPYGGYPSVEFVRVTPGDADPHVNAFILQIRPALGQNTVPAGPDTTLILSFVVADGPFGAMASPEDLGNFKVTPAGGAENWRIQPVTDVPQPYWKVTIPARDPLNGQIRFDNVITHLDYGWTDLVIQYKAVPGFNDGQLNAPLLKFGPPFVGTATAILTSRDAGDREQFNLSVNWDCYSLNPISLDVVGPSFSKSLGADFPPIGKYHSHADWLKGLPDGSRVNFSAKEFFSGTDLPQAFGSTDIMVY